MTRIDALQKYTNLRAFVAFCSIIKTIRILPDVSEQKKTVSIFNNDQNNGIDSKKEFREFMDKTNVLLKGVTCNMHWYLFWASLPVLNIRNIYMYNCSKGGRAFCFLDTNTEVLLNISSLEMTLKAHVSGSSGF